MSHVPVSSACSINPLCAACQAPIGEMSIDIWARAVAHRGTHLLCPECRKHYCDCCGWFNPVGEIMSVTQEGKFLGNACQLCVDWVLWQESLTREDFPHFRLMHSPNLTSLAVMESEAQELIRAEEGERWDR